MKHWGKVSNYLHWSGAPNDTYESNVWFEEAINDINNASLYIWKNNLSGFTGIMRPEKMTPEIYNTWIKFRTNEINIDAVRRIADLARPILITRSKA